MQPVSPTERCPTRYLRKSARNSSPRSAPGAQVSFPAANEGNARMTDGFQIRSLNDSDAQVMTAAFSSIGWVKPIAQFQRYLAEQAAGSRICLVATVNGHFAGYVTVNWGPTYPGFVDRKIPEIQDLNVLPPFRRKGIATMLLDRAEGEVACRSDVVGFAVGLHPG